MDKNIVLKINGNILDQRLPLLLLLLLLPVILRAYDARKKAPFEIPFFFLFIQAASDTAFKTRCKIYFSFPTKRHLFHSFIVLRSNNIHVAHRAGVKL
jgi:hypothetical protein